jgi:hypothetical protein
MGGAKLAAAYVDLYFDKNPPRTSILSGMGWLKETWNTPGVSQTTSDEHRYFL